LNHEEHEDAQRITKEPEQNLIQKPLEILCGALCSLVFSVVQDFDFGLELIADS
jgi:hypothetical protein